MRRNKQDATNSKIGARVFQQPSSVVNPGLCFSGRAGPGRFDLKFSQAGPDWAVFLSYFVGPGRTGPFYSQILSGRAGLGRFDPVFFQARSFFIFLALKSFFDYFNDVFSVFVHVMAI